MWVAKALPNGSVRITRLAGVKKAERIPPSDVSGSASSVRPEVRDKVLVESFPTESQIPMDDAQVPPETVPEGICLRCGRKIVHVPDLGGWIHEKWTTHRAVQKIQSWRRGIQKDWVSYRGPQGGSGWRSTQTGEIRYQTEKPSEREETAGSTPLGEAHTKRTYTAEQAEEIAGEYRAGGQRVRITRIGDFFDVTPAEAFREKPKLSSDEYINRVLDIAPEPSDPAAVRNTLPPEVVAKWLEEAPKEHLKLVKEFKLLHEKSMDVYGRAGGGRVTIYAGEWQTSGRVNSNTTFGREAVFHELGHLVAEEIFGDPNPLFQYGAMRDSMRDDLKPARSELVEYLKSWEKEYYDNIKYIVDTEGIRPTEKHGKKLTRAEMVAGEKWLKKDFKRLYNVEFDEAVGDVSGRVTARLPAMGRHIQTMYSLIEVNRLRENFKKFLEESPQKNLARSYVQAARSDQTWPSQYAQANGDVSFKHELYSRNVGAQAKMSENFAEAYSGWMTKSQTFKDRCPHRWLWLDQQFGKMRPKEVTP